MTLRTPVLLPCALALAASAVWVWAQQPDARPLPALMPPGAMLYVEGKDFHKLLSEWNSSPQKAAWLKSSNYEILAQSRLLGRLTQAGDQFANVTKAPVNMNLVDGLAGTRSAIALYNVSYNFSFVYLTELPEASAESTALWKNRANYTAREAAGIPFYMRTVSEDGAARTLAFTGYKGFMVVADDEELMAATLVLLSGRDARSLSTEPWFKQAETERPEAGDLRLVYHLSDLLKTPQFRTYWIQRNQTALKAFDTGIADLFEDGSGFQEQRVMIRKEPTAAPIDTAPLARVLTYAPQASSLYRAWLAPDSVQIAAALRQVVFGEPASTEQFNPSAPQVSADAPTAGTESDLEIRIDERPFERNQTQNIKPLADAIESMQPGALLHVQSTAVLPDQVFVTPDSGVVLLCNKPDRGALDAAMAQMIHEHGDAALNTGTLDTLSIRIEGDAVILSRLPLSRRTAGPQPLIADATRVSVYNRAFDWPHYGKLFSLIGASSAQNPNELGAAAGPAFFSKNVYSLSQSLFPLEKVSITTADHGTKLSEVVDYRFASR